MPGLKTNEREGTRAVLRHARMSPYKVREVLDLIRGKPVHEAEDILRFSERDASFTVGKVLRSAVANAENNDELDPEELFVSACYADEGATIKRWRPRARGRATRIRKRTSHITVIVSRLPDEQLRRLLARRRAEQLAQRARRVAGARRSEGDQRSRAERRHGGPVEPEAVPEVTEEAIEGSEVEAAAAPEVEAAEAEAPEAEAPEAEAPEAGTAETETDEVQTETAEAEEPAAESEATLEDASSAPETAGGETSPDQPDEKDEK
jgi:large subunit ribosomal protein L22